MKSAVKEIIGKTIAGVVVKEGADQPRSQVFLLFSDGTYYEFYSSYDKVIGISGFRPGSLNEVRRYMTPPMEITKEFVDEELLLQHVPPL